MPGPEELAREKIDAALVGAGWVVQSRSELNIHAGCGVAVRELPLAPGFGFADYVLYVDQQAVGVIEAKKEGTTLTGVEVQAEKYSVGMPADLPAPVRPLPFLYQSTGVETRFTSRLDPRPRSRGLFHFHRPETLARWIAAEPVWLPEIDGKPDPLSQQPATLRTRLQTLPSLEAPDLWPAQVKAVRNLEKSLRGDRARALIQMATGSGKTFAAITSVYRLIRYADAAKVLFLVDRSNLGRQALKEFQQYSTPDDGRKFTELYNVQLLTSNKLDPVARVVITTIQRLFSMLKGEPDVPPDVEEGSLFDSLSALSHAPVTADYNPRLPVEAFDVIFVDECHRSIYSLWRQVLDYFDAYIVGLTATPSKQTFAFFDQNLVMEYRHPEAVADGVNVDFDVYRIWTKITARGSKVEAGPEDVVIGRRDRETRTLRWERLDDDLVYDADALDRQVVAKDQIRTTVRTFRDRLFTEIFPGRTHVPKTLIFAKDDSHADDIVQIVREEFDKPNEFCSKITYKTGTARIVEKVKDASGAEVERVTYKSTGVKPEDLLSSFRNSYNPRIVVTVDMIATGTDVKPLEIVMFMRPVRSRGFFEQMQGRGVRVIGIDDLKAVTPDAAAKDRFVLVDCVGVCGHDLAETHPLERCRTVAFPKLLEAVAAGSTDREILSSLASRLARMDRRLGEPERKALADLAGGRSLGQISTSIVTAIDPDCQVAEARRAAGLSDRQDPTDKQVDQAARTLIREAVAPIATIPQLRQRLVDVKRSQEQIIDHISQDQVLAARYAPEQRELLAQKLVRSFKEYIEQHKDEITALQVMHRLPYRRRLTHDDIKGLADLIQAPPRQWTAEVLWNAYQTLEKDRVRGAGSNRLLTDIVSLVRFALGQDGELVPFAEGVNARFERWLVQQEQTGRRFTDEQRAWLLAIRDHVAANLEISMADFEYAPFTSLGGAGRAYRVFGPELAKILDELNEVLAA
ncbi:MAG: DEAD/DEAH box helicase family protein [Deltaproteobacteria bacterium]|nr:DEAD/DEAH box helicase family protein [Deltaproteobacteria bacterium]